MRDTGQAFWGGVFSSAGAVQHAMDAMNSPFFNMLRPSSEGFNAPWVLDPGPQQAPWFDFQPGQMIASSEGGGEGGGGYSDGTPTGGGSVELVGCSSGSWGGDYFRSHDIDFL